MDIRTLLTESKPFLPKRKVDSILQDSPSTSSHGAQMSESIKSDVNTSVAQSLSASMPKKVKFTLNEATSAPGPRSFTLTISPTDPPSAITATVKDFFALHNCGVSFTDQGGCILIITPDNLTDDMDVIVNQTSIADNGEKGNKKRRKTSLSSRKKTTKMEATLGREIMEEEEEEDDDDAGVGEESSSERRERVFSSDVSIDNILESSRRRLSKFSSEVYPPHPIQNNVLTLEPPTNILQSSHSTSPFLVSSQNPANDSKSSSRHTLPTSITNSRAHHRKRNLRRRRRNPTHETHRPSRHTNPLPQRRRL